MSVPLACEFAKMRRLRVTPVVTVMIVGIVALTSREITNSGFMASLGDPTGGPWLRLLASLAFAVPLVSPILVAVLASRQVDLEHQGNGWIFAHTAGLPAGKLCRTKFLATGAVLTVATLLQSTLVIGIGKWTGIAGPFPDGQWWAYTLSAIVVNLVLLALHLLLAAWIENQLIGLGISVIGVFLAASGSGMPPWLAHLTPWTYYALATPVDYSGTDLVSIAPWHLSILVLGVLGALAFLLLTRRLDRQEA